MAVSESSVELALPPCREVVAVAGGYPFPAVQRFLNGFQLGVKSSCADCEIFGKYLNAFDGSGGVEFANEAVAAGADGVMVEVHQDPEHALTDGAQSLTPEVFGKMMKEVAAVANAVGREL